MKSQLRLHSFHVRHVMSIQNLFHMQSTFIVFVCIPPCCSPLVTIRLKWTMQWNEWLVVRVTKHFILYYRAVDGYLITVLAGSRGCTHTEDDLSTPTPWWTVDLQDFYQITNVTITNRIILGRSYTQCFIHNNYLG